MARLLISKFFLLAPVILVIWFSAGPHVAVAETIAATPEKSNVLKLLVVDADTIDQSRRLDAIASLPMSDNDVIVPWLKANTGRLEPEYLFELGRRLVDIDPDAALEWWEVAHVG